MYSNYLTKFIFQSGFVCLYYVYKIKATLASSFRNVKYISPTLFEMGQVQWCTQPGPTNGQYMSAGPGGEAKYSAI